jgi:hypothetical protein
MMELNYRNGNLKEYTTAPCLEAVIRQQYATPGLDASYGLRLKYSLITKFGKFGPFVDLTIKSCTTSQLIKHFELNVHNIRLQVVGLISKSNIVDKVRDCLIEWETTPNKLMSIKIMSKTKEMIYSILGFIILKGTRTILCLIRSENLCIFDK